MCKSHKQACFVSIAIICVVSVYLLLKAPSDLPFDSIAWKKGDIHLRGRMIPDLGERKLLVGKTKEEVTNLLGLSEGTNGNVWGYQFKYPSAGWNSMLILYFDTNKNTVVEIRDTD